MDCVKQYVFSSVVYCFIRSYAYIFIEVTYAHELHVGRWLFIFCKGLDQLTAALLRQKRGREGCRFLDPRCNALTAWLPITH